MGGSRSRQEEVSPTLWWRLLSVMPAVPHVSSQALVNAFLREKLAEAR